MLVNIFRFGTRFRMQLIAWSTKDVRYGNFPVGTSHLAVWKVWLSGVWYDSNNRDVDLNYRPLNLKQGDAGFNSCSLSKMLKTNFLYLSCFEGHGKQAFILLLKITDIEELSGIPRTYKCINRLATCCV